VFNSSCFAQNFSLGKSLTFTAFRYTYLWEVSDWKIEIFHVAVNSTSASFLGAPGPVIRMAITPLTE